MTEFKKILCCTGSSRCADAAFETAGALATMPGRETCVPLAVPASPDYERTYLEECSPQPFPSDDKVWASIERSCAATCGASVVPLIKHGLEAERIIEAESEGADLIVMGARGVGFFEGLIGGGSVADKAVKNASAPVMLVP